MKPIVVSVLAVLLFASCEKTINNFDIIEGEGNVVSEERNLSSFSKVESRIGGNIEIVQRANPGVTVSLQENLLPYLETSVRNGTLIVTFGSHNFRTDSTIIVYVYTPSLAEFSLTGAGVINSALPIEKLNISGSGTITCAGERSNVHVSISGAGNINLFEMPVQNADVKISGSGNVRVSVSTRLDVSISGMGSVYYKGHPSTIMSNITGLGHVIDNN
jgi:hypothetical protein